MTQEAGFEPVVIVPERRIQPDQLRRLLPMIRSARRTHAKVLLADLSFVAGKDDTSACAAGSYFGGTVEASSSTRLCSRLRVVCVSKFVPIEGKDGSAYADSRNALPNRYASPLTSPLRADVSPDGENHFRFDLEP